jgi:hypothetical protein
MVKQTQQALLEVVPNGFPLKAKLLARPPFTFIYHLVSEVGKKTEFALDLFSSAESNIDFFTTKERKIAYLTKIICAVKHARGTHCWLDVRVSPLKVVAGVNAEDTNVFLRELAAAAKANMTDHSLSYRAVDYVQKSGTSKLYYELVTARASLVMLQCRMRGWLVRSCRNQKIRERAQKQPDRARQLAELQKKNTAMAESIKAQKNAINSDSAAVNVGTMRPMKVKVDINKSHSQKAKRKEKEAEKYAEDVRELHLQQQQLLAIAKRQQQPQGGGPKQFRLPEHDPFLDAYRQKQASHNPPAKGKQGVRGKKGKQRKQGMEMKKKQSTVLAYRQKHLEQQQHMSAGPLGVGSALGADWTALARGAAGATSPMGIDAGENNPLRGSESGPAILLGQQTKAGTMAQEDGEEERTGLEADQLMDLAVADDGENEDSSNKTVAPLEPLDINANLNSFLEAKAPSMPTLIVPGGDEAWKIRMQSDSTSKSNMQQKSPPKAGNNNSNNSPHPNYNSAPAGGAPHSFMLEKKRLKPPTPLEVVLLRLKHFEGIIKKKIFKRQGGKNGKRPVHSLRDFTYKLRVASEFDLSRKDARVLYAQIYEVCGTIDVKQGERVSWDQLYKVLQLPPAIMEHMSTVKEGLEEEMAKARQQKEKEAQVQRSIDAEQARAAEAKARDGRYMPAKANTGRRTSWLVGGGTRNNIEKAYMEGVVAANELADTAHQDYAVTYGADANDTVNGVGLSPVQHKQQQQQQQHRQQHRPSVIQANEESDLISRFMMLDPAEQANMLQKSALKEHAIIPKDEPVFTIKSNGVEMSMEDFMKQQQAEPGQEEEPQPVAQEEAQAAKGLDAEEGGGLEGVQLDAGQGSRPGTTSNPSDVIASWSSTDHLLGATPRAAISSTDEKGGVNSTALSPTAAAASTAAKRKAAYEKARKEAEEQLKLEKVIKSQVGGTMHADESRAKKIAAAQARRAALELAIKEKGEEQAKKEAAERKAKEDEEAAVTKELEKKEKAERVKEAAAAAAAAAAVAAVKQTGEEAAAAKAPKEAAAAAPKPAALMLGMRIEGNYDGEGDWYPGVIAKVNTDGTFDIAYNDGDEEEGALAENVRAEVEEGSEAGGAVAVADEEDDEEEDDYDDDYDEEDDFEDGEEGGDADEQAKKEAEEQAAKKVEEGEAAAAAAKKGGEAAAAAAAKKAEEEASANAKAEETAAAKKAEEEAAAKKAEEEAAAKKAEEEATAKKAEEEAAAKKAEEEAAAKKAEEEATAKKSEEEAAAKKAEEEAAAAAAKKAEEAEEAAAKKEEEEAAAKKAEENAATAAAAAAKKVEEEAAAAAAAEKAAAEQEKKRKMQETIERLEAKAKKEKEEEEQAKEQAEEEAQAKKELEEEDDEDDGYGDDEFDDYEDDFEED